MHDCFSASPRAGKAWLFAGSLALALALHAGAAPEAPAKLASLVLPQGVTFELGPVTLTRSLENATVSSKSGSSSAQSQTEGASVKKTAGSGTESVSAAKHAKARSLGGAIGGGTGGEGGFSLLGLLGVKADVSGNISSEESDERKDTSHRGAEESSESASKKTNSSASEFEEVEQYGSYHLKFSVTFKSKDLSDTFLVGGPNSRVILEGFSSPVPVPYTERQEPVRLRAEPRTCFFDYPIADQVMLRDAKRMVAQGRRNAVTLSLIGDEFPVISDRTKENVISEITRLMKLSPNTLVGIEFGDAKRLSPWRVRRKFTKASGRKGQRVTVREALQALNETLAEDEEMPDEALTFASDGHLSAVVDTPTIAEPKKGDVALVLFSVVGSDAEAATEVHFPTKEFLARPLGDFAEVRLITGSLAELAKIAVYVPSKAETLSAEVESALPSVPAAGKLWKGLLARYEAEKKEAAKKPKVEVRKAGETKTITLPGGATMMFCWCPAGSFTMGSPASEAGRYDDEEQHQVTLTKGFWMGKYEVTQRQWTSVMGANPSEFQSPDRPVENVSWNDCQVFIQAVRRANPGLDIRLPTEAEWEYACRAGTQGAYAGNLGEMAWYDDNSGSQTHVVGTKKANPWGIHDMHGNVWEWCQDWYDEASYGGMAKEDPVGPSGGTNRVNRGGGWLDNARSCRSADRYGDQPSLRDGSLGLRLCCSAGPRE